MAQHEQAKPAPVLTPRRCRVAHAWLTEAMHADLAAEANRRRLHPDELLARIIESVLENGWIDAVLKV